MTIIPEPVRRIAKISGSVLLAVICVSVLNGETEKTRLISGYVTDARGKRLPHVSIRVTNVNGTVTSDSGEFEITLPQNFKAGDPIIISVDDWIVVEPFVSGIRGKLFLPRSTREPIEVSVAKKGDEVLLSAGQIKRILEQATSNVAPELGVRPQNDVVDEFLSKTAQEIGFSIDELKAAITRWANKVEDPFEKGLAAFYQQHYSEASRLLDSSLRTSENDLVDKYLLLAATYNLQGDYYSAEMTIKKAYALRNEDVPVLDLYGAILNNEGKFSDAESLLKLAKDTSERLCGGKDPAYATALGNLGYLYTAQSRFADAEPLQLKALEIDKSAYGLEHPAIAIDMTNVGVTYLDEGKYPEAQQYLDKALTIDTRIFGPDSPQTLKDLTNLGALYEKQDEFGKAQRVFEHIVDTDKRKANPSQASVATHLGNLGTIYMDIGRESEAESLLKQEVDIDRSVLGPTNPGLAKDLANLGFIYTARNKYDKAIPLLEEARNIDEKALVPTHADTAEVYRTLALCYSAVKRHREAMDLASKAASMDDLLFGKVSIEYASDLSSLGEITLQSREFERSQDFYNQALSIFKNIGARSSYVGDCESDLGRLYYEWGKYRQSEDYYEQALQIYVDTFGENSKRVATAELNLATVLKKNGKVSDAKRFMEKGCKVLNAEQTLSVCKNI